MAAPALGMTPITAEYMDVSQHLPAQLQRAFDTIRGLDEQDGALISGLEELLRARLGTEGGEGGAAAAQDDPAAPSPAKRARPVPGEQQQQEDVERVLAAGEILAEHASEKCTAAKECYEAVDALIVRLDRDLTAFDTEFMRARLAAVESEGAAEAAGGGLGGGAAAQGYAGQVKKKKGALAAVALPPGAVAAAAGTQVYSLRADLAVDPNEPTYCTCNRVSFGDMIACESESCPVEWFHFECVGLSPPPPDKWYCPSCAAANAGGPFTLKVKLPAR